MRWAWISLLVLGCGARTTLEAGGDASTRPPPRDAGTDAPVTPPPPPPTTCSLGPPRGPYVDGAPAFVFSLVRFQDPLDDSEGEYLVGYAHGWPPDERGALSTLDLDLGAFHRTREVGAEQVAAAMADPQLLTFTEEDHVLDVAWLALVEDGWPATVRTNVCHDCDASFSAMTPVVGDGRGAITYEAGDAVVVWVAPIGGGASPLTTAFVEEGSPHLAAHRDGYVLASHTTDRTTTRLRFLDRDLAERALVEVPISPTGAPPGLTVRDDDVLMVGRASVDGGEHLVRVTEDGVAEIVPLALPDDFWLAFDVTRAHGVVAVVALGLDSAQAIAFRDDTLEPVLEPTPVNEGRGTYTRTAQMAEHPDGFAIAYGGWEPEGFYGVYGRLLSCIGFD